MPHYAESWIQSMPGFIASFMSDTGGGELANVSFSKLFAALHQFADSRQFSTSDAWSTTERARNSPGHEVSILSRGRELSRRRAVESRGNNSGDVRASSWELAGH